MKKPIAGFSLVELMISITIGLVITLGISTSYINSKSNLQLQTALATLHIDGQYALSLLIKDISNAGYFGETGNIDWIAGTSSPVESNFSCSNTNEWGRMIGLPIYGLNDTNKINNKANYRKCISNGDYLRGDIVTVRMLSEHTVAENNVKLDKNKQKLYSITAPDQGRIFQGKDLALNNFTSPAQNLRELHSNSYYIGPAIGHKFADCGGKTTPPSLFRESLNKHGKPQREELVQGIENLQIHYGIDTDGDGYVNQYTNAALNLDWSTIVSARIWILVRAQCPETGFKNTNTYLLGDQKFIPDDGYRRLLLSSTVTLRHL